MTKPLIKKIKQLPQKPGVYFFKDEAGRLFYIGKARDLRKRAQSHFNRASNLFLGQFTKRIADIDWIETKNEKQALLLENQLIKKYQPRFNIQLKDDKSYFWVTFSDDEWPRVIVAHQNKLKIDAIGPFVNGRELRKTLRVLRKVFPYRTCKNSYDKPCLQWHLGLCPAHKPNSKVKSQKSKLQVKIQNYQNSLNALSQFLRLYAGERIKIEAYDISNIQGKHATGSMIVFHGSKAAKNDYRRFRIKSVKGANDVAMVKEVLKRRLAHKEWPYPDLILIDGGKAQLNAAKSIIHDSKFMVPVIALAKSSATTKQKHWTEHQEEIYTEYSGRALRISELPESLHLALKHIRDEAHRFAIFYYRYLHRQKIKINETKRPRGLGKTNRKTR